MLLNSALISLFLSTPSARRATKFAMLGDQSSIISIHALREEGDLLRFPLLALHVNFYPRPPRGGRLCCPLRWASIPGNFYPRPPRGGRQPRLTKLVNDETISIHALREEGDTLTAPITPPPAYFYPRPPRGGRPVGVRRAVVVDVISIHALREEGDLMPEPDCSSRYQFLSTPSARRATGFVPFCR